MHLHDVAFKEQHPQKAQNLLFMMEKLYTNDPTNTSLVRPDSTSYITVIEGWCQKKSPSSTSNIQQQQRTAGTGYVRTRDIDQTTTSTLSTTLTTINGDDTNNNNNNNNNNINNDDDVVITIPPAEAAQMLLNRMEESNHLVPNALTYLMVCQKWAESCGGGGVPATTNDAARTTTTGGGYNAAIRAQHILETYARKLNKEQQKQQDKVVTTKTTTDNNTIAQSSTIESHFPSTSLGTFCAVVVEAWSRLIGTVPDAMERAEMILKNMEAICLVQDENCNETAAVKWCSDRCDLGSISLAYTSFINGLSRSRRPDLARKADKFLEKLKAYGIQPDVVAYTSALNCWAKATSRVERQMASQRVLELLQELEDAYIAEDNYLLKPSPITYATATKAIGYSLDPNAPKLAEDILRRMYELTESGKIYCPPTVTNYNAVITALSTSGSRKEKAKNARKAEAILVEMIRRSRQDGEFLVEPSHVTWGSLLRAFAESGLPDCGEQAQRVLDKFESLYESGDSRIRPNVVCYTTVMQAWARDSATAPDVTVEKANQLLSKLEELYILTRDESLRPNKVTYITVIDVYCRKKPQVAGSMSQALVDRMMQLYSKDLGFERPTRIVFNTLINAWSRSKEENAADNAENVFQFMESQRQNGDELSQPDEVSLCGVLNAWANNAINGGALRAQQIMDHTVALTSKDRGFDHNIVSWNVLIKAWGRSRETDSVQQAEKILTRLEEHYKAGKSTIKPDITTYSSVINCCAYYNGPRKGKSAAFEVAWRTYNKIKNSDDLTPNNIVYGTLFKAVGKLTSKGRPRERIVKDLFVECCRAGQVCSFVLGQFRAASPMKLYRTLVLKPSCLKDRDAGNFDTILKNMPKEWSRNVVI